MPAHKKSLQILHIATLFLLFWAEPVARGQYIYQNFSALNKAANSVSINDPEVFFNADSVNMQLSGNAFVANNSSSWLITNGKVHSGYNLHANGIINRPHLTLQGALISGYWFAQNKQFNGTNQNELINPFLVGNKGRYLEKGQFSSLTGSANYRLNHQYMLFGAVSYQPSMAHGNSDPKSVDKISNSSADLGITFKSKNWSASISQGVFYYREEVGFKNFSQLAVPSKYLFSGFGYYQQNDNDNFNRMYAQTGYKSWLQIGYAGKNWSVLPVFEWRIGQMEIRDLESYEKPKGSLNTNLVGIGLQSKAKVSGLLLGFDSHLKILSSVASQFVTVDSFHISGGTTWAKTYILATNNIVTNTVIQSNNRLYIKNALHSGSTASLNLESLYYFTERVSGDELLVCNMVPSIALRHEFNFNHQRLPVQLSFGKVLNQQSNLILAPITATSKRLNSVPENLYQFLKTERSFLHFSIQYYLIDKSQQTYFVKTSLYKNWYHNGESFDKDISVSMGIGVFL